MNRQVALGLAIQPKLKKRIQIARAKLHNKTVSISAQISKNFKHFVFFMGIQKLWFAGGTSIQWRENTFDFEIQKYCKKGHE